MGKWTEAAMSEGSGSTDRLPDGDYDGQIARVVTIRKEGTHLASKKGEPQIMVCMEDIEQTGEATCTVTLSEKAFFVLAKLLKACGADMDKLDADDTPMEAFADQEVCDEYLTGKPLRFNVKNKKSGDKTYANAMPIVPDDAPKLADSLRIAPTHGKMTEAEFNAQSSDGPPI